MTAASQQITAEGSRTMKSHSSTTAIEADELERIIMDAALALDQRKDSFDHVKARALRAFGAGMMAFFAEELNSNRDDKDSDVVMAMAEITAKLLMSINATCLAGSNGQTDALDEIEGMAIILTAMASSTPWPNTLLIKMISLYREADACAPAMAQA